LSACLLQRQRGCERQQADNSDWSYR